MIDISYPVRAVSLRLRAGRLLEFNLPPKFVCSHNLGSLVPAPIWLDLVWGGACFVAWRRVLSYVLEVHSGVGDD